MIRKIAHGGMAEIFLALQVGAEGFEKPVVLKRILPALGADPAFVRMLVDEAHIASSLSHSHLVQVLDLGKAGDEFFLVLEFVDGWSLEQVRRRARKARLKLPLPLTLYIVSALCRALDYVHRRTRNGRPLGIVHRDVTPQNVLLSREGDVKLADFGIAKSIGRREKSATGVIKGKFAYMSPEQTIGAELDARSDLFSVGTLLYLLTTGQKPFDAPTDLDVLMQVRKARYEKPSNLVRDFNPDVERFVARALRADRARRWQSAEQMADRLDSILVKLGQPSGPAALKRWLEALTARDGVLPPGDVRETAEDVATGTFQLGSLDLELQNVPRPEELPDDDDEDELASLLARPLRGPSNSGAANPELSLAATWSAPATAADAKASSDTVIDAFEVPISCEIELDDGFADERPRTEPVAAVPAPTPRAAREATQARIGAAPTALEAPEPEGVAAASGQPAAAKERRSRPSTAANGAGSTSVGADNAPAASSAAAAKGAGSNAAAAENGAESNAGAGTKGGSSSDLPLAAATMFAREPIAAAHEPMAVDTTVSKLPQVAVGVPRSSARAKAEEVTSVSNALADGSSVSKPTAARTRSSSTAIAEPAQSLSSAITDAAKTVSNPPPLVPRSAVRSARSSAGRASSAELTNAAAGDAPPAPKRSRRGKKASPAEELPSSGASLEHDVSDAAETVEPIADGAAETASALLLVRASAPRRGPLARLARWLRRVAITTLLLAALLGGGAYVARPYVPARLMPSGLVELMDDWVKRLPLSLNLRLAGPAAIEPASYSLGRALRAGLARP